MKAFLFRPAELGKKSCEGVSALSKHKIPVVVSQENAIPRGSDLCIRWGSMGKQPVKNVLNKVAAMNNTVDKGGFRRMMQDPDGYGKRPENKLCPYSWGYNWGRDQMRYPCVVRPDFHAKGQMFYLCKNEHELEAAIEKCGGGWYATEYIEKVAEYRINVLQGRVLCVIEKSPKNKDDLVWAQGNTSIVRWSNWPLQGVRKAVEALAISGLDFAGVDVIQNKAGDCYVLELNTAPFLEGEYQRECFALGFDYIIDHDSKEHIPLVKALGDWKKFIHPAISDMAKV